MADHELEEVQLRRGRSRVEDPADLKSELSPSNRGIPNPSIALSDHHPTMFTGLVEIIGSKDVPKMSSVCLC